MEFKEFKLLRHNSGMLHNTILMVRGFFSPEDGKRITASMDAQFVV